MWAFVAKCLESSTLLLLASSGECLNQRSGILNVGIEGLMLFGAVTGFIAAKLSQSLLLGFLAGMAVGALVGLLHAFISITLKVDQVVSGMGIWILAYGITTFIGYPYTGPLGMPAWRIGGISPMVFISIGILIIIWFLLKTNLGLKIRSIGENPLVAEASGIHVNRIRYLCTTIGGMMGGLAGAFLSLVYLGVWTYNLTAGRGWIALALVFFSAWNPWLLLIGTIFFGTIWQLALSPELIFGEIFVPLQFLRMIPFGATIVLLCLTSIKVFRMKYGLAAPASLGKPYIKE